MNQNVQDLIERSRERKTFRTWDEYTNTYERSIQYVVDPEKLVDLVVQECLARCDEVQTKFGKFTFTADECRKAIKEHFGVK